MPVCLVKYTFNYNFNLPQEYAFLIRYKNQTALIRSSTFEGREIMSYMGEDLAWTGLEPTHMMKASNIHGQEVVARKIFDGGYVDYAKFTIFEVMFEINSLQALKNKDVDSIKSLSDEALRKFFDVYRIHFRTDLKDLNTFDSPLVEFYGSEGQLSSDLTIGLRFTKYTERMNLRGNKFDDSFEKVFNKEDLDQFQNFLNSDFDITIFEKMLLNSREQAQIYSNYALSIVLSETAFECFLQEFLISRCEINNIPELPVGRGGDQQHQKNYKDAIINGNVVEHLIKIYLKIITGKNIAGSKEYNAWHQTTYSQRNEIIHKGMLTVSQEDAKKSLDSVLTLVNKIQLL